MLPLQILNLLDESTCGDDAETLPLLIPPRTLRSLVITRLEHVLIAADADAGHAEFKCTGFGKISSHGFVLRSPHQLGDEGGFLLKFISQPVRLVALTASLHACFIDDVPGEHLEFRDWVCLMIGELDSGLINRISVPVHTQRQC